MKITKVNRKKLVKELDRIFSLYIRKRDKVCVNCGSRENLTCGHLFSRVAYSTRWDERNGMCQCAGCNMKHEHDSYPLTKIFIDKYSEKTWHELHRIYSTPKKFTNEELGSMIKEFKDKLENRK